MFESLECANAVTRRSLLGHDVNLSGVRMRHPYMENAFSAFIHRQKTFICLSRSLRIISWEFSLFSMCVRALRVCVCVLTEGTTRLCRGEYFFSSSFEWMRNTLLHSYLYISFGGLPISFRTIVLHV